MSSVRFGWQPRGLMTSRGSAAAKRDATVGVSNAMDVRVLWRM